MHITNNPKRHKRKAPHDCNRNDREGPRRSAQGGRDEPGLDPGGAALAPPPPSTPSSPTPRCIPFADKVPTPTETLDITFAFWGKLLDAQHAFLSELVDDLRPHGAGGQVTTVTPPKKV